MTFWTLARAASLAFALLLTIFSSHAFASTATTDTERMSLDTLLQARQIYALVHTPTHGHAVDALGRREQLLIAELNRLAEVAHTHRAIRHLAVMQRVMGDPGWKSSFLRLAAIAHSQSPFEAERELAMWSEAFGDDPVRPSRVNVLLDRIARLDLGWYQHLAMETVYQSAGMMDAAGQESRAALRSSASLVRFLQVQEAVGRAGIVLAAGFGGLCVWRRFRPGALGHSLLRSSVPTNISSVQAVGLYRIFGLYLALYGFIQFGLSYTLENFADGQASRMTPAGASISLAAICLWICIPTVLLWRHVRRSGMRLGDLGLRSEKPFVDILWGFAGYAVAVPIVWCASAASEWFFSTHEVPLSPVIRDFAGTKVAFVQILLLCQATIIAPVFEEIFFRGVFYRSLAARMMWLPAMLLTATVFAIAHGQLPGGFLSLLALGIVFNALYRFRGSLVPSITAHAINNAAVFISLSLLLAS